MSVALVKQTITGSELPTGPLYSYARHAVSGQLSVFRCSALGVVEVCHIIEPITNFTNVWLPFCTLTKAGDATSEVAEFIMPKYYGSTNNLYTMCMAFCKLGTTLGNRAGAHLFWQSNGSYGASCSDGGVPGIIGLTHVSGFAYLGKDVNGSPQHSGRLANKCIVVNNAVQCYGQWFSANIPVNGYPRTYLLLDPNLGIVGMSDQVTIKPDQETSYFRLNMPTDGIVRWFAEGYYLCTDPSNNMFLYKLEDLGANGVLSVTPTKRSGLVAQLTGTYDPTLPIELLTTVGL